MYSSRGRGDEWDTVIYPGMKQALINALQVTQDEIEHRKVSHTPGLISGQFPSYLQFMSMNKATSPLSVTLHVRESV